MEYFGRSISLISGFALVLISIIISQGEQHVLSVNKFGIDYGKGFSDKEIAENVLLYQNETIGYGKISRNLFGEFFTTAQNIYFNVRYEELNKKENVTNTFAASKYFDEQQNGQ